MDGMGLPGGNLLWVRFKGMDTRESWFFASLLDSVGRGRGDLVGCREIVSVPWSRWAGLMTALQGSNFSMLQLRLARESIG